MKIKVEFTVEVDADAWALEYGVDRADVREDVKGYAAAFFRQQVEALGLEPAGDGK